MRLTYVCPFALSPKSTVAVRVLPLARELVRRGHEVSVLIPPWDNPEHSGRCWEDQGVSVSNLTTPAALSTARYPMLALRLLKETLRSRPDIVHVFKPKGFSGAVAQAILGRRRLTGRGPVVVIDTDDWEGRGGWNDRGGYPWWQRACFAYQERALLQGADALTAASRTLEEVAASLRGSHRQLTYLPNGPGVPAPQPGRGDPRLRLRLGIPPGPLLLLYTRFVESGPERTASLLATIRRRGIDPTVLLVGKGLNGEEGVFQRLAGAAGVRVIPSGWVEPGDLWEFFAAADLAIFPAEDTLLNRAKCSVKLVDLLHAGVPVVAEAVGQCLEYIEDGVSGVLVPPERFDAFAIAVERLLADPSLRERLATSARSRIAQQFSWSGLARRLEASYLAAWEGGWRAG